MSKINDNKFLNLRADFDKARKKILKENISKNEATLNGYLTEIIQRHNDIITYTCTFYGGLSTDEAKVYKEELIKIRNITLQCLTKLNKNVSLSNDLLVPITSENIHEFSENSESEDENEANTFTENSFEPHASHQSTLNDTIVHTSVTETDNDDSFHDTLQTNNHTIAQISNMPDENTPAAQGNSKVQMLQLFSRLICNYNGDVKSLMSFVNSVELAKETIENQHMEILKKFVLSRLETKALDCVDTTKDIDGILNDLKKNIKHDSSKVIEGRLMSLNLNKITSTDFSQKAEQLAEDLQRALIIEGISREKAQEMAVERTIAMCRQSAKNDTVKTVIAASKFENPKEVIAKLITEQNTHEVEKQILSFRSQNSNRGNRNFRGNRGRNFNNRGGYNQNSNNRNGNYRNNNRGRGNWNGGRRNFNDRRNNNNNNNNNGYNVRVTSENSQGPSGGGQDSNQNANFSVQHN